MKLYPVHIQISYTSGRQESVTIKSRLDEWQKDLKRMVEEQAVASYTIETAQDHANAK